MNKKHIEHLAKSLRRDLRQRVFVWPTVIVFLGLVIWREQGRMMTHLEQVMGMHIDQAASPMLIRNSAIQAMIPLMTDFALITIALVFCGYCIMELIRGRTNTKLLLAIAESLLQEEEANKIAQTTATKGAESGR
jgi:hypothetical protein